MFIIQTAFQVCNPISIFSKHWIIFGHGNIFFNYLITFDFCVKPLIRLILCDTGFSYLKLRKRKWRRRLWSCQWGTVLWPLSHPWWLQSLPERTQMCFINPRKVKHHREGISLEVIKRLLKFKYLIWINSLNYLLFLCHIKENHWVFII